MEASLVAQTLHRLCRATLVALHCVAFFALKCRTRLALHPLKCLKKGPVAFVGGGGRTSTLHCIDHNFMKIVAVQGVSQLQCHESRYTAPLRRPPVWPLLCHAQTQKQDQFSSVNLCTLRTLKSNLGLRCSRHCSTFDLDIL